MPRFASLDAVENWAVYKKDLVAALNEINAEEPIPFVYHPKFAFLDRGKAVLKSVILFGTVQPPVLKGVKEAAESQPIKGTAKLNGTGEIVLTPEAGKIVYKTLQATITQAGSPLKLVIPPEELEGGPPKVGTSPVTDAPKQQAPQQQPPKQDPPQQEPPKKVEVRKEEPKPEKGKEKEAPRDDEAAKKFAKDLQNIRNAIAQVPEKERREGFEKVAAIAERNASEGDLPAAIGALEKLKPLVLQSLTGEAPKKTEKKPVKPTGPVITALGKTLDVALAGLTLSVGPSLGDVATTDADAGKKILAKASVEDLAKVAGRLSDLRKAIAPAEADARKLLAGPLPQDDDKRVAEATKLADDLARALKTLDTRLAELKKLVNVPTGPKAPSPTPRTPLTLTVKGLTSEGGKTGIAAKFEKTPSRPYRALVDGLEEYEKAQKKGATTLELDKMAVALAKHAQDWIADHPDDLESDRGRAVRNLLDTIQGKATERLLQKNLDGGFVELTGGEKTAGRSGSYFVGDPKTKFGAVVKPSMQEEKLHPTQAPGDMARCEVLASSASDFLRRTTGLDTGVAKAQMVELKTGKFGELGKTLQENDSGTEPTFTKGVTDDTQVAAAIEFVPGKGGMLSDFDQLEHPDYPQVRAPITSNPNDQEAAYLKALEQHPNWNAIKGDQKLLNEELGKMMNKSKKLRTYPPEVNQAELPKELQKCAVMDLVMLNLDHANKDNFLVRNDNGHTRVHPIDYGNSMPSLEMAANILDAGNCFDGWANDPFADTPIDPEIDAAIGKLDPDALAEEMRSQSASVSKGSGGKIREMGEENIEIQKLSVRTLKLARDEAKKQGKTLTTRSLAGVHTGFAKGKPAPFVQGIEALMAKKYGSDDRAKWPLNTDKVAAPLKSSEYDKIFKQTITPAVQEYVKGLK